MTCLDPYELEYLNTFILAIALILDWVLPKANPETRITVQVVHLESGPSN